MARFASPVGPTVPRWFSVLPVTLIGLAALASAQSSVRPAAATSDPQAPPPDIRHLFVRTIDGSFNNLRHPTWGQADTMLRRETTNGYGDGASEPAGADRPSARLVSNVVVAQSGSLPNPAGASDLVWQWGQFIDHDLDLTGGASPAEPFHVPVPIGDPWFDPDATGTAEIALDRSLWMMDAGVRQQMNAITAYLDGSMVYGSDQARADELRTLDGTGRLKTSAGDLLPFNVNGFPNAPTAFDPTFFLAGDVRANEQVGLTGLHTLFVREHNYWAGLFGFLLPFTRGDTRYELARAIVGAEIQVITYEEFLPVLLGPGALSPYVGYNQRTNATIENLFSTACYRFGHSMINTTLLRLDASGDPIADGHLALKDGFFTPAEVIAHGIEPVLRGQASQAAQNVDSFIVDDLRNFLFGPPGSGGFDLASLNIQRGRDHGLPSYNEARADYGLAPAASFADVTSDGALQAKLSAVYGTVDKIDAWVGGLAEDPFGDGLVGELVRTVLVDQFERMRDGDRFWYQRMNPATVALVSSQSLRDVIVRNTSIDASEIQGNVFVVPSN